MFTRYTKGFLGKEVIAPQEETSLPPNLFTSSPLPSGVTIPHIREDVAPQVPETVLSEHVHIKGELAFKETLRIDGSFEGTLLSDGKLIVGPKGVVKAHISLQEAFIAGTVEGDITVKERLVLRGHAKVIGNITAPLLSVDEGVSINGKVTVEQHSSNEENPLTTEF